MELLETLVALTAEERPFAVALVLRTQGSTPREAGARALVDDQGRIWGTIGGGAVEGEAIRRAIECIHAQTAVVFDFVLEGTAAADPEPICGGRMRVLLDPAPAAHRAVYAQAGEAAARRRIGVLLTTVRWDPAASVQMRWVPDGQTPPGLEFPEPAAVRECLNRETASYRARRAAPGAPQLEALLEPVVPSPRLLVAGGGHVGQAVARQAARAGFEVTVLDDRPEFVDPDRFPEEVKTLCGDIHQGVAGFPIDRATYVVIATRGHRHDATALAACIRRPAAYVGMIGSRRKVGLLRQDFVESGRATAAEFDRVFAPIGLPIGAETVPEIAASVVAELIAVRRRVASARWKNRRQTGRDTGTGEEPARGPLPTPVAPGPGAKA
jgi:xanthine dehydrogenase accessory factor